MSHPPSPEDIAALLLAKAGMQLHSVELLQSLWAGYGYIYRLTASALNNTSPGSSGHTSKSTSTTNSGISTPLSQDISYFILKFVAPPAAKRPNDEGHARKTLSYRIEHYFYTHLAPQLPAAVPVAKCLAHINEPNTGGMSTTALVMSDLRQEFPVAGEKRDVLSPTQVDAALRWLASFHGFWWTRIDDFERSSLVRPPLEETHFATGGRKGQSVWLNGGYTYLATRRSEYANLASDMNSEWSELLVKPEESGASIAEMVATLLAPREDGRGLLNRYQTLIHGDVKSENLYTSRDGTKVAFYDFQYVGLGLGVSDLAKLFTVSVPLKLLVGSSESVPRELGMQPEEELLLKKYCATLQEVSGKDYDWSAFRRHWEIALVDWLRFQASWGFWGNTEWLESRVRYILRDSGWKNHVRYDYSALST